MTANAENRASHRRTTYNGGEIILGASKEKIGCIVRDLSAKGARLEVRLRRPPSPTASSSTFPRC